MRAWMRLETEGCWVVGVSPELEAGPSRWIAQREGPFGRDLDGSQARIIWPVLLWCRWVMKFSGAAADFFGRIFLQKATEAAKPQFISLRAA